MAATNGWDVLKIFCLCSFFIACVVILLANLNQPKCEVTVTPDQNTIVTVNDIIESKIYDTQFSACPGVISEYANYLNSLSITFSLNTPCPENTQSTSKAVGDWTACYPPGQFTPPPQQLMKDLAECSFTITTAAPWKPVVQNAATISPIVNSSSYMPDVSYMVV